MSAEILEQVASGFHGAIDIIALHRARRACGYSVGKREHYRRLVVKFGESRSDDTDNSLVPIFVVDNDSAFVGVELSAIFEYSICFIGDLLVEFLSVLVVLVDIFAELKRLVEVASNKQFDSLHSRLHSSGSIDARTDFENHITDCDFLVV